MGKETDFFFKENYWAKKNLIEQDETRSLKIFCIRAKIRRKILFLRGQEKGSYFFNQKSVEIRFFKDLIMLFQKIFN